MDVEELASIPLFADLTDDELSWLAGRFQEVRVLTGAWLARKGQWGYRFFVVLAGTASVAIDGTEVAALGPGDFFGEIAVSANDRRTADVQATSRMRLGSLLRWDYNAMMERYPSVAARVEAARAQRLA